MEFPRTRVEIESHLIREKMVTVSGSFATSGFVVVDQNVPFADRPPAIEVDTSLSRQLIDARRRGFVAEDTLYIPTAYSAIPVADAIRGAYSMHNIPEPAFSYVDPGPNGYPEVRHDQSGSITTHGQQEIARLTEVITATKPARIVTIEQHEQDGHTLTHAVELIVAATKTAGVPDIPIAAVRGRWYGDMLPFNVDAAEYGDERQVTTKAAITDLGRVTVPKCRDVMYTIGQACAVESLRPQYNRVTSRSIQYV